MKKMLVLIISLLLIISCGEKGENYTILDVNGLKVYKNKNTPAQKDLKINLTNILSIKGESEKNIEKGQFSSPTALDVDKDGNIFVFDRISASVKKFDKDGNFISSFGRQGTGPGEIKFGVAMNILGDTVIVADDAGRKLVKFSLDGQHISDSKFAGARIPKLFSSINKDSFLGYVWSEGAEGNDCYV